MFCAIITPFPSANPSALITVGNVFSLFMYSRAFSALSNTSYFAVGILYFFIRFFENTLLPSIIAADLSGPNVLKPSALSASTIPRTSGSSGATTTKSAFISFASATIPSISVAFTGLHSA